MFQKEWSRLQSETWLSLETMSVTSLMQTKNRLVSFSPGSIDHIWTVIERLMSAITGSSFFLHCQTALLLKVWLWLLYLRHGVLHKSLYLQVILGPGLRREGENVRAVKPGLLRRDKMVLFTYLSYLFISVSPHHYLSCSLFFIFVSHWSSI